MQRNDKVALEGFTTTYTENNQRLFVLEEKSYVDPTLKEDTKEEYTNTKLTWVCWLLMIY